MKKLYKKGIIFIAASLIIMILGNYIFCEDKVYYQNSFIYQIDDNGSITIVKYEGKDETVVIPRYIDINANGDNRIVSVVAKGAFVDTNVKFVIIPDTIFLVEDGAFGPDTKVDRSSMYDELVKKYKDNNSNNSINQSILIEIKVLPDNACGYIMCNGKESNEDNSFRIYKDDNVVMTACENPGYIFSHWEHNNETIRTQSLIIENVSSNDGGIYKAYYIGEGVPEKENIKKAETIENKNAKEPYNKEEQIRPFLYIILIVLVVGFIVGEKYITKKYRDKD